MRFLTSVGALLAVCGLAAAGHLHHQHHHQHAHKGSSYVAFTKHEEPLVKHEWTDQHHHYQHHHQHETAHLEHKSAHDESDTHEDYDGGNDHEEDYYAPPKYEFDYAVKDEKTGDAKKHWETREGDKVKGAYTIKEADGTTRIVEYTADHKNGYNAVVKTVGHAHIEHESHDHSHYGH